MSLINEALKRTRNATLFNNAAPSSGPGYRGTAIGGSSSIGPRAAMFAFALSVMLALTALTLLAARLGPPLKAVADAFEMMVKGKPDTTPTLPATIPAPAKMVAANPQPVVVAEPQPTEEELVARVVERIKSDQATAPATPAPTPAPPPEPPKLTLQGITSDGSLYEAMINGFTVRVGDEIEGARVVAIDGRTVKLQVGDRDVVLRMP